MEFVLVLASLTLLGNCPASLTDNIDAACSLPSGQIKQTSKQICKKVLKTYSKVQDRQRGGPPPSSSCPAPIFPPEMSDCPADAYLLPPLENLKKNKPPWNIKKIRHPERVDVQDGMLKLSYQEGVRGGESGAAVFANPFDLLPADEISMDYEVFLPESFEWVKAGKFPGIALGKKQGEHASGGNWKEDAGSFRIMWRDPQGDRALIKGYLYLAIHGGIEAGFEPQGPDTKAALNVDDRTGFSMWYKKQPGMYAEKCKWNSMGFTVILNTPGKADGVLEMRVNGVTKRVDDVVWRTSGDVKIVDMYFVSIFGGRAQEFACKKATHALFRNIRFAPVK